MAWLVLLGSGFLLASVTILDQLSLQITLLLVFLLTGLAFYKNQFVTYLAFSFVYPLLPSQNPQLSSFDFLEFIFLCVAFWWAFSRIRANGGRLPSTSLNRFLAFLIVIFSLSTFLWLLRHHYILSEVFLLKLRASWNIFDSATGTEFMTLSSLMHFLEGVVFFFITVDLVESRRIRQTVQTIVYSAVIVSGLGVLQYVFKFGLLQYWVIENPNITRINSTFSDPNSLGSYLASIFCIVVFGFVAQRQKWRIYYSGFAVLILMALIFTASRAAWAATFLALLIAPVAGKLVGMNPFPYLKGWVVWAAKRGIYVAVFVIALLVGAALVANVRSRQPESLVKMLLFTFNPRLPADAILKGRVKYWKTAVSVFRDYPVFGSGPGSFRFLLNAPYFVTSQENAHNYFLQLLAETGLPAFLLFLLIIGLIFRDARKSLRTTASSNFLIIYGLLSALFAFLLTSLTGHPMLLLKLQLLFWGIIGLLMARERGSASFAEPSRGGKQKFAVMMIGVAMFLSFFFEVTQILKTRRLSAYEYGYHGWERDEQRSLFRWTKLHAVSLLDVKGELLSFRLRQFNPDVGNKPVSVKLYLNDQLLDTIHLFDTSWNSFRFFLPHLFQGQRTTFRIVSQDAYKPRNSEDQRELGVGIQSFVWECAGGTPIGVHEEEREGDKIYFWTRGQASFALDREGSSVAFRILPNLLAQADPIDVWFYWNRKEIGKQTFSGSEWAAVSLRVPEDGQARGVLTLRVSRTANLKQLQRGEDARDLGVRMELPFQWKGSVVRPSTRIEHISNPELYAVANSGNRPVRLLLFPKGQFSLSKSKVKLFERVLQRQTGLHNLFTPASGSWVIVYPDRPFKRNVESFVWKKVEKDVQFPSGPLLIRMRALGGAEGGDVPIASLQIDGREIARQPILSEGWIDYYFRVDLPHGGRRIAVEFLNDLFLADVKVDRNLLVYEIAIAKANSSVEFGEGWDIVQDRLLITEFVDRNLPFLPRNGCYTIETDE